MCNLKIVTKYPPMGCIKFCHWVYTTRHNSTFHNCGKFSFLGFFFLLFFITLFQTRGPDVHCALYAPALRRETSFCSKSELRQTNDDMSMLCHAAALMKRLTIFPPPGGVINVIGGQPRSGRHVRS